MTDIRIVLAEDNLLVREGLVSLISTMPNIEVVATSASLPELIEQVGRHQPDLVLTDIRMPPTQFISQVPSLSVRKRSPLQCGTSVSTLAPPPLDFPWRPRRSAEAEAGPRPPSQGRRVDAQSRALDRARKCLIESGPGWWGDQTF